jgi:peptidyl-prolyl cis-trans isomerase C
MSSKHLILILAAVFWLLSGDVTLADEQVRGHANPVQVLVRVNDVPITHGDVLHRVRAMQGDDFDPARLEPNAWQRLLEATTEQEILDLLLYQAALRAEMSIPETEVTAELERSRALLGKEQFTKMLADRGADEAQFRAFLRRQALVDRYRQTLWADIVVDESKVHDYYEGHRDQYVLPPSVRLSVMILPDTEVLVIVQEALKAGTDFEVLAAKHSVGYARGLGGPTRWMPIDAVPEDIREKVREVPLGTVLPPVVGAEQVNLVKLLDRHPGGPLPFEKARDQVRNELRGREQMRRLDDWYAAAAAKARIDYVR